MSTGPLQRIGSVRADGAICQARGRRVPHNEGRAASIDWSSGTTDDPEGLAPIRRDGYVRDRAAINASSFGLNGARTHTPDCADVSHEFVGTAVWCYRRRTRPLVALLGPVLGGDTTGHGYRLATVSETVPTVWIQALPHLAERKDELQLRRSNCARFARRVLGQRWVFATAPTKRREPHGDIQRSMAQSKNESSLRAKVQHSVNPKEFALKATTHQRRRRAIATTVVAVTLSLAAASCSSSDSENQDSVTLSFSTFVGEDNPHAIALSWFMDEVTERSDGRIQFDANFLETSCPAAEQYQCVTDGRADLSLAAPVYEPQRFPITLITSIPYLGESNTHNALAFQDFYANDPVVKEEYEKQGLELLGLWTTRLMLGGSGTPYSGPEDLAGKNIRTVGGPTTTALSLAGANPIALTANELYEALERGVVDAYANAFDAIAQYGLLDHSDFIVDTRAGAYTALEVVINGEVYMGLDEDLRQILDDVSAELPLYAVEQLGVVADAACEQILDEGNIEAFEVWTLAAAQEWSDLVSAPLRADWEKTAAENGVADPSATFDGWLDALEAVTDRTPDAELECAARF